MDDCQDEIQVARQKDEEILNELKEIRKENKILEDKLMKLDNKNKKILKNMRRQEQIRRREIMNAIKSIKAAQENTNNDPNDMGQVNEKLIFVGRKQDDILKEAKTIKLSVGDMSKKIDINERKNRKLRQRTQRGINCWQREILKELKSLAGEVTNEEAATEQMVPNPTESRARKINGDAQEEVEEDDLPLSVLAKMVISQKTTSIGGTADGVAATSSKD